MKKLYSAPIAELILLRADSRLAKGDVDFDDFFNPDIDGDISDDPTISIPDQDIDLPNGYNLG